MMRKLCLALALLLLCATAAEANPFGGRFAPRGRRDRVRLRVVLSDRQPVYRPVYDPFSFAPRSFEPRSRFSLDLRLGGRRGGCVGPWCP
jgi:hypothetical protein